MIVVFLRKMADWIGVAHLVLVIYIFTKSFWWGLFALFVYCFTFSQVNQLETTIATAYKDDEKEEEKKPEPVIANITGTPKNFFDYKGFTVENFNDTFFRFTYPNGEKSDYIYPSLERIKEEIDGLENIVERPVYTRRKVTNIRFVR